MSCCSCYGCLRFHYLIFLIDNITIFKVHFWCNIVLYYHKALLILSLWPSESRIDSSFGRWAHPARSVRLAWQLQCQLGCLYPTAACLALILSSSSGLMLPVNADTGRQQMRAYIIPCTCDTWTEFPDPNLGSVSIVVDMWRNETALSVCITVSRISNGSNPKHLWYNPSWLFHTCDNLCWAVYVFIMVEFRKAKWLKSSTTYNLREFGISDGDCN